MILADKGAAIGICNYLGRAFNSCSGLKYLISPQPLLLLLGCLTVAAHELVDATSGVDELALTGIERV